MRLSLSQSQLADLPQQIKGKVDPIPLLDDHLQAAVGDLEAPILLLDDHLPEAVGALEAPIPLLADPLPEAVGAQVPTQLLDDHLPEVVAALGLIQLLDAHLEAVAALALKEVDPVILLPAVLENVLPRGSTPPGTALLSITA